MRTHDSNDNPAQQPEPFCELTGGYDDVDHARAAKRLSADLRAMDATPRAGHTPGPWEVCDGGHWKGCLISPRGHGGALGLVAIASLGVLGNAKTPEADANRKLIAAAPDLLEALQSLVNICTHPNATKAQMQQIANESRAAIARATR